MVHPNVRTWTLATLDPGRAYRLWLDPVAFRWEVALIEDGDQVPLITRDGRSGSRRTDRACAEGARPRPDSQAVSGT